MTADSASRRPDRSPATAPYSPSGIIGTGTGVRSGADGRALVHPVEDDAEDVCAAAGEQVAGLQRRGGLGHRRVEYQDAAVDARRDHLALGRAESQVISAGVDGSILVLDSTMTQPTAALEARDLLA